MSCKIYQPTLATQMSARTVEHNLHQQWKSPQKGTIIGKKIVDLQLGYNESNKTESTVTFPPSTMLNNATLAQSPQLFITSGGGRGRRKTRRQKSN